MRFKDLVSEILTGTPVKRKSWEGYWQYQPIENDVKIYVKDGTELWLFESDNTIYTVSQILQDDWEIATSENSILKN